MKAKKESLKFGISSCLLGNKVRYDGGHKLDSYLRNTLGHHVEWVPICPEAACGLSIPREAMHLVHEANSARLVTKVTCIDHTEPMMQWAKKRIDEFAEEKLCGFVLKARSPSCGVHDAKFFSRTGKFAGKGAGLFAATVMNRFPLMPVVDEEELQDARCRKNFFERVFVYLRWQELT